jgi:Kdo2-lipid IVA lauroyltransferase/acyltransferase
MADQNSNFSRILNFVSRRPLSVSRFFARFLALIVNTFKLSKTSDVIRLNLNIALPHLKQSERESVIQTAISNELVSYFEFFHIWGSDTQKNIKRIQNIHNEYLFHEAIAENKGLVLIVPHFGTWEIMNSWFAQYTNMTIMYKPIKNDSADEFVRNARSREQATLVPTDESGVRQIFRALKQGGTTVILPDHTPDAGGELIPYFGIPLNSSSLSAKLIQKTKSNALFVYALRNDTHGFDMYIGNVDPAIYEVTAEAGTQIIHKAIENLILKHPEHYHWSYKRFSANPELRKIYKLKPSQAMEKINEFRAKLDT